VPRYAFHPKAEDDIVSIWTNIAGDSPNTADGVTDKIIQKIETAATMPRIGSRRPDLTSRPLRFLYLHSWLIAYAPDEQPLWIVAILDGRRDPRVLAAILRERESKDSV
jgi:plasmid stabilization system protein ParE